MTEKQQSIYTKRNTKNHPWRRMNNALALKTTNWRGKPVKPKNVKP